MRLALAAVGVVLMLAPPYVFALLNLVHRLGAWMIAGVELASLVVGFMLLYLALRGQALS